MLTLRAETLASIYGALAKNVYTDGDDAAPKGKPCSEILPVTLAFTDIESCAMAGKGVNYRFATAELMAYLCGWDDVAWLARFNKNIVAFSDDGEGFSGAYGPRMEQQLEDVIALLSHDEQSRQAIVQIWQQRDLTRVTKDKPCHTELQLFIRGKVMPRLHMIVHQRSCDMIWGLPYDHYSFCMLQIVLANLLGVEPGTQFRVIGSLHVYKPGVFYPMERIVQAFETPVKPVVPTWWMPRLGDEQGCETLGNLRADLEAVRKWLEHDTNNPQPHHEGPLGGWQLKLARYLEGTA